MNYLFGFVVLSVFLVSVSATCGNGNEPYSYCGGQCFVLSQYVCHNNQTLCPVNAPDLCGRACYNSAVYKCCFGINLAPINQACPPIPECCPRAGPLFGTAGQRQVCYSFINQPPFAVNPTTGEPFIYYSPCSAPNTGKLGCTGVPAIEAAGCRMCGLDPVIDVRCVDPVKKAAMERSGKDFQCPCEVVEYLRTSGLSHLLPPIYRVDPVCSAQDCGGNPGNPPCTTDCGPGVCYDPSQYVCNPGNKLCPVNAPLSCGDACYSNKHFTCCPGNTLMTGPNATCPDNTPTNPGCCPESVYLGTQQERNSCYNVTLYDASFVPNPTTGEPYFWYLPCTPLGDRSGCVDGYISNLGCRQCFLDPVNDIRCAEQGTKRTGPDAYTCPCDIIPYLFERNPALLPAIYKKPAQCPVQLPEECTTNALFGAIQVSEQTGSGLILVANLFLTFFAIILFN